jgi:hypothetical protein
VFIGDRRRPIVDRETGLFVRWYFLLRLEEEIARGARFGERFTVARIATRGARDGVVQGLAQSLRTVDYAGDLDDAIAIVFPNTATAGAQAWKLKRLGTALPPSAVTFREYPVDGQTASALIGEAAWDSAEAASA